MIRIPRKEKNYAVFLFFAALLVLGTVFFLDYGVSWDETLERVNGICSLLSAYEFLTGKVVEGTDLSQWGDRYYGNGLQHIMLVAEFAGGCLAKNRYGSTAVWMLRHWLTFVFTLTGLFFMYLTGRLLWRSYLKALVPVVLFLFMPRFVAESFYNIKDIGLLAGMMFGGYFMVRCIQHPTYLNSFMLGAAAAFVSSIRLIGLQLLIAGIGIAVVAEGWCCGRWSCKKILLRLLFLMLPFTLLIILFYPAGWSNPAVFFMEAFAYMQKHPWAGIIRFCGRDYIAGTTPWYYLPVWIGVTTPVPLLLLLFTGTVCVLKKVFFSPVKFYRKRSGLILLAFFCMFWTAVVMLPVVMKNYYNGWRHFYFLGYPMLMLAGCGLINLFKLASKKRALMMVLASVIVVLAGLHVAWMMTQHPHQYLYFNALAGDPQKDFELDYWHVSNTNAVRTLMEQNKNSGVVKTLAYDYTIYSALAMAGVEEDDGFAVVSRFGFHDYAIVVNDNDLSAVKYARRGGSGSPGKIISDRTVWVKNSLWTKQLTAYRILEFARTPGAVIKPVQY